MTIPQAVKAHGEVHIRINAVTRQIETNQSAHLYLDRGELHRQDKNWTAAEADYACASEIDPTLAAVDFCRAGMLADSGQLEAARLLLSKVLERDATDGEAFVARARVLVKLQQSQVAIADFRRGLELLPAPAPEYFVELSQALVSAGQPQQALQSLDEGLQKLGPILTLQIPALDLELERKNYDAALARLETILPRAHRKENWLARRGEVLLAAGRKAEARQAYEEALAAIKTLPGLVQRGPSMVNLQTRVTAALAGITQASVARN